METVEIAPIEKNSEPEIIVHGTVTVGNEILKVEDFVEIIESLPVQPVEPPKVKKTLKKKKIVIEGEDKTPAVPRVVTYYKIDISDIPSYINAFNKFMVLHPEFFKTNVSKKLIRNNNNIYQVFDAPVYFKDAIHEIKGFIESSYENDKFSMSVSIKTYSRASVVNKCYISQVEEYILDQAKNGDRVELYYYKILGDTVIKQCFYNQPYVQWCQDIDVLKAEFFMPGKDALLAVIESKKDIDKCNSINTSWNNLVLQGRVGSGKSSMIYRTAMILKMSIVSVDISLFLNKKKELYSLLYGQEFNLPGGLATAPKEAALTNCVIALEEFDNAIDKLVDIENIFKYKTIIQKEYLKSKNDELKEQTANFKQPSDDAETDAAIKAGKEVVVPQADNYEDFMTNMLLEDGIDTKNNKVDKMKMQLLSDRSQDNNINSINHALTEIIKSMDDDNKSNILRKSDLLELFSPAAPVKGRIIIGTTNHLSKMKKIMPALFRAGRLTAVEFPYLDWQSLNELTEYYLQNRMTVDQFTITIPTSEIVEMAVKYKLGNGAFADFEKELKALCIV
jgi:hypothetical protein